MAQPVQSAGGTISVHTTERGLPVALRLDPVELKKPPAQLADEIMALCRVVGGPRPGRTQARADRKGLQHNGHRPAAAGDRG